MRRQTRCALVTVVQTCALPSSSVVAIVDQITGSLYGWIWLDPLMGIVGALVIAKWSWGLMRDTGATMLDYRGEDDPLKTKIRQVIAAEGDRITDLHDWQTGESGRESGRARASLHVKILVVAVTIKKKDKI